MCRWINEPDRVLRGKATRLSAPKGATIRVPAVGLTVAIVLLGLLPAFCVGWFPIFSRTAPAGAPARSDPKAR